MLSALALLATRQLNLLPFRRNTEGAAMKTPRRRFLYLATGTIGLHALLKKEIEKWRPIIKAANIRSE